MANEIVRQAVAELEAKESGKKFVISALDYNGGDVQVSTDPDDIFIGFLGPDQDTWETVKFYVSWSPGAPVTIENQINRNLFLIQYKRSE